MTRLNRLFAPTSRPHLPPRTLRWRLTGLYGGLFLLSGAALLSITYVLVRNTTAAGYTYHGSDGQIAAVVADPSTGAAADGHPGLNTNGSTPRPLSSAQAQELAHQVRALASRQRADQLHELLTQSGLALAMMAAISVALGWLVAGRVLRPLRTITDVTQTISATNLHQRLALAGPDDELKRLADTIDNLLARLGEAFDAQRRFVANASHELRTPVTVVRALAQMTLTDPNATVDSFRATCNDIVAEGEHQERLIEALLVLARTERGLDHQQTVDIAPAIRRIVQAHQSAATRLKIRVDMALQPAHIDGDPRLLERLVTNLIDNSIQHNFAGGHVEIACGMRDRHAFIRVGNSGPIFDPETVPGLVQPFQRGDADLTNHHDGHGLGLSIVHAIAKAHDAVLTPSAQKAGGLDIQIEFPVVDLAISGS